MRRAALLLWVCLGASCAEDTQRCRDVDVGGLGCACESFADCAGLVCGADGRCESADPRCFPVGSTGCPCLDSVGCAPNLACQAGVCARPSCGDEGDCATGQLCLDGTCFSFGCTDANDCRGGHDCTAGRCVPRSCQQIAGEVACYSGAENTAKLGACDYGIWQCKHDGTPICAGEVVPVEERCDGADNDCDGETDETGCPPLPPDCAPVEERCDGVDNDCDGLSDEDLGAEICGRGVCQRIVSRCDAGVAQACRPGAPQPGACNGLDDDCDGEVDEADEGCRCAAGATQLCYPGHPDAQGQGLCHAGRQRCEGGVWGACSGAAVPEAESCSGRDADCDGVVDNGVGQQACGVGACAAVQAICVAGAPRSCEPAEPGEERCNAVDDDCDGETDEGGVCACDFDPDPGAAGPCETRVCEDGRWRNEANVDAVGTPCAEAPDACHAAPACDAQGRCGEAPEISDPAPNEAGFCQLRACHPERGFETVPHPSREGQPCGEAPDACHGAPLCGGGDCAPAALLADPNPELAGPCEVRICDLAAGWQTFPDLTRDGASCGPPPDSCHVAPLCAGGVCEPAAALADPNPDAAGPCRRRRCDPGLGWIAEADPTQDGAPCGLDTGDPCTVFACGDGECGERPLSDDCGERSCGPSPSGCYTCGGCGPAERCVPAGFCDDQLWVQLEPGTFTMGSPDGVEEFPAGSGTVPVADNERGSDEFPHRVTLTRRVLVGATEVTNARWDALMDHNPSAFPACADCPVETVNWWEALAYANALSELHGFERCYALLNCDQRPPGQGMQCALEVPTTGGEGALGCRGYRLLTEAEWEYAARAGSSESRYGDLTTIAQCCGHAIGPQVAGDQAPNAWGLFDMIGNVFEWVWDRYGEDYYELSPSVDPTGAQDDPRRVVRGCGWFDPVRSCRTPRRHRQLPSERPSSAIGIRVARSLP